MAGLLNVTQLAKELGVSKPAITKAYKSGRLPVADRDKHGHPLFDLDVVKNIWENSAVSSALQRRVDPTSIVLPQGGASSSPDGLTDAERLLKARADDQERDAELKAIKIAKERGESMLLTDVKAQSAALAKVLMGFLTSLPDRLASQVVGMSDTRDVRDAVFTEVSHMIRAVRKECGFAEDDSEVEGE